MLKFLQNLAKIRKPAANLREALLAGIRETAEAGGLAVSERPGGYTVQGRGETAAVVVQFGGRREFYETMENLEKDPAAYRAIVTSSNVKTMKIGEIKWILNNKYQTKNRWMIIDVEHKESPKTVNFMLYADAQHEQREEEKPRRKKIYGRRGEHKEQD